MMVRSRRYAGGLKWHSNEDLVREAFAVLSRDELDWLQRQYLAQDIRCHFISPHHRWQADRGLEEVMKRAVRWTLLSVGLAGVVMAVTVEPPHPAGPRRRQGW